MEPARRLEKTPLHLVKGEESEEVPKPRALHRLFLKSTIKRTQKKIEFNEELIHHLTDPEVREALARGEIHPALESCASFRQLYSPVYSAMGALFGMAAATLPQGLRQAHATQLIHELLPNMEPSVAENVHRAAMDYVGRDVPPRELALGVLLGAAIPFYWGAARFAKKAFSQEARVKRAARGYRLPANHEEDVERNRQQLDKLVWALKQQNTAHARYLEGLRAYARQKAVDKALRVFERETRARSDA